MAKKRNTLEDGISLYKLPEVEVVSEPFYMRSLNSLPLPLQRYF